MTQFLASADLPLFVCVVLHFFSLLAHLMSTSIIFIMRTLMYSLEDFIIVQIGQEFIQYGKILLEESVHQTSQIQA